MKVFSAEAMLTRGLGTRGAPTVSDWGAGDIQIGLEDSWEFMSYFEKESRAHVPYRREEPSGGSDAASLSD
jgi:hypothetical protein